MRNLLTSTFMAMALLPMPVLATCVIPADWHATGLDEAASQIQAVWRPTRPLLVGEIHGTNEVPRIVATLLERQSCEHKVLLLLEIPETEQARIDAFMRSNGKTPALRTLLAGKFWTQEGQDGRSSEAMVDLIARARGLHAAGRTVALAAFAPAGQGDGTNYETRMTDNLRRHVVRHPQHQVITLVGNYHSGLLQIQDSEPDAQPMGWQLRDLDPLSITVFARSGAYWACDMTQVCGEKVVTGAAAQPGAESLKMATTSETSRWHGRLMLDEFTASGPGAERVGKP